MSEAFPAILLGFELGILTAMAVVWLGSRLRIS